MKDTPITANITPIEEKQIIPVLEKEEVKVPQVAGAGPTVGAGTGTGTGAGAGTNGVKNRKGGKKSNA